MVATLALMAGNTCEGDFELGIMRRPNWVQYPWVLISSPRKNVCGAKVARERTRWPTAGSGNQVFLKLEIWSGGFLDNTRTVIRVPDISWECYLGVRDCTITVLQNIYGVSSSVPTQWSSFVSAPLTDIEMTKVANVGKNRPTTLKLLYYHCAAMLQCWKKAEIL